MMVLTVRSARFRTGAKLIMIASSLLLVLVAWAAVSQGGSGKVWTERISAKGLAEGYHARIEKWKESLELGLSNPVMGVGFGNEKQALYFSGFEASESHNDLVSALATTGIPGLLLFLGFLGAWLWEVWHMPRGVWRSALLGMWLAFITTGLFNPSLSKKPFWLAAAICATSIVCANHWLATRRELPHADEPSP